MTLSVAPSQSAPSASPAPRRDSLAPGRPARLLTEQEVLAAIRREVTAPGSSLTKTAQRYGLQPSQVSDIQYGRAQLSARVIKKLGLKLHKFYERLPAAKG